MNKFQSTITLPPPSPEFIAWVKNNRTVWEESVKRMAEYKHICDEAWRDAPIYNPKIIPTVIEFHAVFDSLELVEAHKALLSEATVIVKIGEKYSLASRGAINMLSDYLDDGWEIRDQDETYDGMEY